MSRVRKRFRPGWLPTLATLALLALLLGLGFWQLDRAEQKRALQAQFRQTAAAGPLRLDWHQVPGPEWRYRPALVSGRYDGRRQFLLDNRVLHGRVGYQVLTPLLFADGQHALLVNRGWVPAGPTRDLLPELPVPEGVLEVRGLVDFPPERVFSLGEGEDRAPGWPKVLQRIRLDLQSEQLGLELVPWILLLDPQQPGGFAREWAPVPIMGPERHVGYAVQWFGLAAALLVIYFWVNWRPVSEEEKHAGGDDDG